MSSWSSSWAFPPRFLLTWALSSALRKTLQTRTTSRRRLSIATCSFAFKSFFLNFFSLFREILKFCERKSWAQLAWLFHLWLSVGWKVDLFSIANLICTLHVCRSLNGSVHMSQLVKLNVILIKFDRSRADCPTESSLQYLHRATVGIPDLKPKKALLHIRYNVNTRREFTFTVTWQLGYWIYEVLLLRSLARSVWCWISILFTCTTFRKGFIALLKKSQTCQFAWFVFYWFFLLKLKAFSREAFDDKNAFKSGLRVRGQ